MFNDYWILLVPALSLSVSSRWKEVNKSMMMKNGLYLLRSCSARFNRRSHNIWPGFCGNCLRNSFATLVPKEDTSTGSNSKQKKKKKPLKKALIVSKPEVKAKTKLSASAQLVHDYIGKHCGTKSKELTSLLPKQCLKLATIAPISVYLIDEKEAKHLSNIIKLEDLDKEAPVVELHPGLGLLTSELANEIGFKHVTCIENCSKLAQKLTSHFNVPVINCSWDDMPRQHHLDKHDGGERINSMLTSIKIGENADDDGRSKMRQRQLNIIGAIPNISTINFLIRCYVTKRVFFEDDLPWSGVTLIAALGAKATHICNAMPETGLVAYRPTSVFFQTLFTSKEIGTVSRKSFVPWQPEDIEVRSKMTKKKVLKVEDPTVLRVLRIELNTKVQDQIGKDNLFAYWYFVRQSLYARTNRIIPELERWIPGCGVKLIKQGYTIYSQFGTLKPNEILELYLHFVSLPEFVNSSFLNAVEKFQARLELSEEEEENK